MRRLSPLLASLVTAALALALPLPASAAEPAVEITPLVPVASAPVTCSGTGFAPSQAVTVTINAFVGNQNWFSQRATITADASGAWRVATTLPALDDIRRPYRPAFCKAERADITPVTAVSRTPAIGFRNDGPLTDPATVSGIGFQPGEVIKLAASAEGGAKVVDLGTVTADDSGRLMTSLTLPSDPTLTSIWRLTATGEQGTSTWFRYWDVTATSRPSLFHPISPARVYDSREDDAPIAPPLRDGAAEAVSGAGDADSLATHPIPVGAGTERRVSVAGRAGIPADASAVVLNVTVTDPQATGPFTVFPYGTETPLASNLNVVAGQTSANLVTVMTGFGGAVSVLNRTAGSAHVVVDVAGYYLPGEATPGALTALAPTRILDTREGLGVTKARVGQSGVVPLKVTGVAGVPASDVAAVVMNVTAVDPTAAGHVDAYPAGQPAPVVSNINVMPGDVTPNHVTVKVGDGGVVNLANITPGTIDLVADIAGYYTAGTPTQPGAFVPLEPVRVMDSRTKLGASGFTGWATRTLDLSSKLPAGASAAALNLTVTEPKAPGYATGFPAGGTTPLASNLNFTTGQTKANAATIMLTDRKLAFTNGAPAQIELIADLAGYFR